MDNQQERLIRDKSWFVGILEGEGWFSMVKGRTGITRFTPSLGICNTDSLIINELERILKEKEIVFKTYSVKPRMSKVKMCKPSWQLMISGQKRCIPFLEWIMDELRGEKKKKAELILEYCNLRKQSVKGFCGIPYSERENEICLELRSSTTIRQTPKGEDIV